MKSLTKFFIYFFGTLFGFVNLSLADGAPNSWQIGFQDAASPLMEEFTKFHNELLYIIVAVSIFVMLLLAYVVIKFNAKANKVPSKTTHNTFIEIIWTAVPVIILLIIMIPSIKVLKMAEEIPEAELTVKVIGYQWYWGYQYPDNQDINFNSMMIPDNEIKPGEKRLLSVDNPIVLPIDTSIRVQLTSADVIHSWAVPSLGVKKDAVPGRLNETWLKIDKVGTYYGQCSELCGQGHGFMPIEIKAVSKADFKKWVKKMTKGKESEVSEKNIPSETSETAQIAENKAKIKTK